MQTRIIRTVALVLLCAVALSCTRNRKESELLGSFTDDFLAQDVVPRTRDIARFALDGLPLDTNLLQQRRITCVEVIHVNPTNHTGNRSIVYQNEGPRPEYQAMITVLPRSRIAGMYIPKDLDSSVVELRMNYDFGTTGHAAVHIVTERPNTPHQDTRGP